MPCCQHRVVLSCHGCAYENTEKCILENKHLPGNEMLCKNCIRNPKPTIVPTLDCFIPKEDIITQLQKVMKQR